MQWSDIEKTAAQSQRAQQDLQMWNAWNTGGRRVKHMEPLVKSFSPMINAAANKYIRNPKFPLGPEIIKGQFKIQFMKAMETYNPQRGTQLNTHVFNTMRKTTRFLMKHQNIGAIPEVRSLRVREFQDTRANLAETLNREPNHTELSEALKWSPKEVKRMESELTQATPTMDWEDDPIGVRPSQEQEVLNLFQIGLKGEDKLVFEHIFGAGGKPQLAPGQIAKKLKWTPSKVTRIKNRLMVQLDKYL